MELSVECKFLMGHFWSAIDYLAMDRKTPTEHLISWEDLPKSKTKLLI